jgi:hypothetical protein
MMNYGNKCPVYVNARPDSTTFAILEGTFPLPQDFTLAAAVTALEILKFY